MDFDGKTLVQAVKATFDRRKTVINSSVPIALTDTFAIDTQKNIQWKSFLTKSKIQCTSLDKIVEMLSSFLLPVIEAIINDDDFLLIWQPSGYWAQSRTD